MSIWDELEQQEQQAGTFEADVTIEPWHCALVKGQGKVPWDPAAHAGLERRIAITIVAVTNDAEIRRDFLSFDRAWKQTRESIERAGLTPQDFEHPRRARIRLAPVLGANGEPETYTSKTGETRQRTTIEIVAADNATSLQPSPASSSSEQPHPDDPRDARERIALKWITQRAVDANLVPDHASALSQIAQRIYDATQDLRTRGAVAGIDDARWMALCRNAAEFDIPF